MNKKLGLIKPLFLLTMVFSSTALGGNEQEALDAAVKAGVKQLGIDEALNNLVRQHIPEKYIKLAETVAPVVETVSTGTIRLTWELK